MSEKKWPTGQSFIPKEITTCRIGPSKLRSFRTGPPKLSGAVLMDQDLKEIMINKIKWQVYMRNIHVREFLFIKLCPFYFILFYDGFQKIGSKIWNFSANLSINNIKYQNNKSYFCKQTYFENENRDLQIWNRNYPSETSWPNCCRQSGLNPTGKKVHKTKLLRTFLVKYLQRNSFKCMSLHLL